jgi:hypothetical protein
MGEFHNCLIVHHGQSCKDWAENYLKEYPVSYGAKSYPLYQITGDLDEYDRAELHAYMKRKSKKENKQNA